MWWIWTAAPSWKTKTVGPSNIGTGELSGATVTIRGTGERVCVIVDPQSVFRDNLQLDANGSEAPNPFMNNYTGDDGDLDLAVGLASYYTGTPGEEIGDFVNDFPDENGVNRRVDLNLCLMEDYHGVVGGTAGRATPEWCDFPTSEDVDYRIVLQVFSVPIDDNMLRYAFEIRDGACPTTVTECTLRGDADEAPADSIPEPYKNVEEMYCAGADG
jgi:hypothetical protein